MGTEQFDRRVPVVGHGENIKLVGQAWGDRVTVRAVVNSPGQSDHIQPAGLFSTAPYIPDAAKTGQCLGKDGECKARPMAGSKFCYWHSDRRK